MSIASTKTSTNPTTYRAGDKVFYRPDEHLATVLDVYGDGINGDHGEIRLDWCGNTSLTAIEPYDAINHAAFLGTFQPIRKQWKDDYGITQDVELHQD